MSSTYAIPGVAPDADSCGPTHSWNQGGSMFHGLPNVNCTPVNSMNLTPARDDVPGSSKQWNLAAGQPLKDGSFGPVQPNTNRGRSQQSQNAVACNLKNDGFADRQAAEHAHVCTKAHSQCSGKPVNPDTGAVFENEFNHMAQFFGNVPYDPSLQIADQDNENGNGLQLPAWHGTSAPGYYETNLQAACPGSVYEQDFEHLNMFDRAGWAPCQTKDDGGLQSLYDRRLTCKNQYVSTKNKVLDRALSTTNRPHNGNPAHASCGMYDSAATVTGDGEYLSAIAGKQKKSQNDRRQRVAGCRDNHCDCPASFGNASDAGLWDAPNAHFRS
jgi:hypothetical protein